MRHVSPSRSLLRRTVHAFFGMGLLNNALPYVLIACGQHHIASGLASILNATTPLFTVLVAHLLTSDEKLTPLKASGVAVGFAGAVVIAGPDALGAGARACSPSSPASRAHSHTPSPAYSGAASSASGSPRLQPPRAR